MKNYKKRWVLFHHLLEKKFLVIQSPLCKKLFYFTCKYELTFWRTLKVFLTVLISHLLPKIYLFSETWIPTVVPKTEISSTFWPITHKLFGPKLICLVKGKPVSFDEINGFGCWPFLSVKTFPNPFDESNCPESLLVIGYVSTKLAWITKDLYSFLCWLELIVSKFFYLTFLKTDSLPLKYYL